MNAPPTRVRPIERSDYLFHRSTTRLHDVCNLQLGGTTRSRAGRILAAMESNTPRQAVDVKPSDVLRPVQLLYLAGNVVHGVTALEDSSALVTSR